MGEWGGRNRKLHGGKKDCPPHSDILDLTVLCHAPPPPFPEEEINRQSYKAWQPPPFPQHVFSPRLLLLHLFIPDIDAIKEYFLFGKAALGQYWIKIYP